MEDTLSSQPNIFANAPKSPRWYHKRWGRVVVVLLFLFLILAGAFIALTASYVRKIKRGDMVGGTTETSLSKSQQPAQAVDPSRLFGAGDPSIGPTDAVLTIVEFGDFECPFCRKAYPDIRAFQAAHPNEVRFIWRDFPLVDVHPLAGDAAEAAACANDQGKFWVYHDKLFENQAKFNDASLSQYAEQVGLDGAAFSECRASDVHLSEITGDLRDSITLGNTGTPTFFVNGARLPGAVPRQFWEGILERARSGAISR
ncbi:MAG: thioredoxin domain-containing protein [bacterium]|nr:thioredoxin domain-containing protein [bacterium]